jgi:hypothetical protein
MKDLSKWLLSYECVRLALSRKEQRETKAAAVPEIAAADNSLRESRNSSNRRAAAVAGTAAEQQ